MALDEMTRRLYATTDAQVWAEEWCKVAREIEAASDGRQVIDEGWMIGWFANAIETGRTAGEAVDTIVANTDRSGCTTARKCRLFHDWRHWQPPERGRRLQDGERVGDWIYQRRECQRCGSVVFRTVAT